MATYMTVQNVPPEQWLAQVTMIDAAVGDSNIIDLIVHGDTNKWTDRPYRRIVIDTGIAYARQKASNITAAIMDALKFRSLPVNVDTLGAAKSPVVNVPLAVDEVQITHADVDHIGNAGELMTKLTAATMLQNTKLRYNYVPPASPILTFTLAGAILDPADNTNFVMSWRIEGLHQWVADLDVIGLDAFYKYRAYRWILISNEEYRDPANGNRFIQFKAPLAHLKYATQAPAGFSMTVDLLVGEMLTEREGNELRAGEYTFEYNINAVLAWLGYMLSPAHVPKPHFALPTQTIAPSYKTTHDGLTRLNPFRYNNPQIIYEQPLDGRTEIRHRKQIPDKQNLPETDTMDVIQMTISPTELTYKTLARYEVTGYLEQQLAVDYYSDDEEFDPDKRGLYTDESIANKASVVTWFRREEHGFDMLFTGDAHDQEADIQDTLLRYKLHVKSTFEFNVLKVPHHGSNTTTHSKFYQNVRARVYLICGQHRVHGNPRFSSLRAIIEGFRGKKRPGGQPFRLYFSDPDAQVDYQQTGGKWMRSPVKKILSMGLLASYEDGDLYYEMYRLRRPPINVTTRVGYGSILFWRDDHGNMMDSHHPGEWDLCQL